jgi:membrane associated rhomboid family serine protease
MTSDSRDYFRSGGGALRFEGWAGTPVTWTLILVHSVLWLFYAGTANRIEPGGTLDRVFHDGLSLSAASVAQRGWIWQVATYWLLHPPLAVGALVYTLAFLFFLGREMERLVGRRRYLFLYVAGGVFAGALSVPWAYLVGWPHVPVATAAGAVYAMVVGLTLRMPDLRVIFGVPLWGMTTFLILLHVAIALTQPAGELMSFFPLAGAGFAWLHHRGAQRWERFWGSLVERRRARAQARTEREETHLRGRLDDLLAKIEKDGIGSLSPKEKDFLQEASKRFR